MSWTWKPAKNTPRTVRELKTVLAALAKKRKGNKLISSKFTKDHLFPGHSGSVMTNAAALARFRTTPFSTLMSSDDILANARTEVLNWIVNVPNDKFTLHPDNKTWELSADNTTVAATKPYTYVTVDKDARARMNRDDLVKKSRNWLKVSKKIPAVACGLDDDGTPTIYHLNY